MMRFVAVSLFLWLHAQALKNFLTGSTDNCTYTPVSYYYGDCKCV
jgi:hypothetical protein